MGDQDRRWSRCWLLPLAAGPLALAGVVTAQEGGGVVLTFGIDQALQWASNPGLETPPEGDSFGADTRLTFGFVSETARDRLAFDLGAVLRLAEDDSGVRSPSANLSYGRQGANASLNLSAFWREAEVGDDTVADPDDPDGGTLLAGGGSVETRGGRAVLTWGDAGPFGVSLSARLTDTDYHDTTDPDLVDNRKTSLGLGFRFDIDEITRVTAEISRASYDEDGPEPRTETTRLSFGVARQLPRGSVSLGLSAVRDDDGDIRTGLTLGRSFDLPNGSLALTLGLSNPADGGGLDPTGSVDWRQELPRGLLTASLSHSVTTDAENDEALRTALSLGYATELTPRMGLNLSGRWNRDEDTGSGETTETATLGLALDYALSEDWGLNFGATHRMRDEEGVGRASSDTIYLSVGRRFEWRP